MTENDHIIKNMYFEVISSDESNINPILEKIKNTINYLSQRFIYERETYAYEEDKYNIIDENGNKILILEIEPLYVNQNDDSHQGSIYDDKYLEVETEFMQRDANLKFGMGIRPNTTIPKVNNRLEIRAKDKKQFCFN